MFGDYFDNNIDNLPETLIYLILGICFNKKINNLPKKLKYLILNNNEYERKINNLPNAVTLFYFGNFFTNNYYLPSSIKYIHDSYVYTKHRNLPNSIKFIFDNTFFIKKFNNTKPMKRHIFLQNVKFMDDIKNIIMQKKD